MDQTPKQEKQDEISKGRSDEYVIFESHSRTDGSHKSIDELEMEYVTLTDKLISKMTDGEKMTINGERVVVKPDVVIFLDKSARPLAWLVRDLWDTLAPEPGSDEIPKRPDFKFLNIDRDQWKHILDPNGSGGFEARHVDEERIAGLRAVFGKNGDGSFEAKNALDDKVIMIVDEVRASGATLDIAQQLVQRAFPSSHVFGTHWMARTYTEKGVGTGNADVPVWYRDDRTNIKHTPGRGVGNRLPDSLVSDPREYYLSTRLPEVDQKALRLRDDFKKLASAVVNREVMYIPSNDRMLSDDEEDARVQSVSGVSALDAQLFRKGIHERDAKVPLDRVKTERLK